MAPRPLALTRLCCLVLLAGCAAPDDPVRTASQRQGLVHEVPGQFATIGDAIRAAADGDEIQIAAGTYETSFVIDKDLTVRGAGIGRTVITRGISIRESGRATLSDLSVVGQGCCIGLNINWRLTTLRRIEVSGWRTGILVKRLFGDFRLEQSTITGNVVGVDMSQVLGGRVASNLVLSNTQAGILARDGIERVLIAHNTVVGNGFAGADPLDAGLALGPFGQERVHNNMIVGNAAGLSCVTCRSTLGNNNVWGNVTDYAADGAAGETDLSVDPRFVSPHTRDFHLSPDSPCVDAGADLELGVDRDGQPRNAGGAPDIGAYELPSELPQLVVNEVMANPLDEGTGEYVELLNVGEVAVAVAGFRLDDGDVEDTLVAWAGGRGVVEPGDFAIILDPDFAEDYALPEGVVRLTVADARLGNGLAVGDPITLRSPEGSVVSTFSTPFNPGNGVSAERLRPELADGEQSWVASPCGASPGRVNCVLEPPAAPPALVITEVMANPLDEGTGEFVELHNAGAAPLDVDRWRISDGDEEDLLVPWRQGTTVIAPGAYALVLDPGYEGQYPLPEGVTLLSTTGATIGNGLAVSDPVSLRDQAGALQATFSFPFNPGNGRTVERTGVDAPDVRESWVAAPCEGEVLASPGRANCVAEEAPPQVAVSLAITEVMANPLDEDTGEFVELYNFGERPIDASTLQLDDGDAVDTLLGMGEGTLIPPGGFAVILDPEYAGEYALPPEALRLRPDDTTLGSGLAVNDEVRIMAGAVLVSRWATPFNPGNGRSVERIALDRDGADVWIASPCPSGASPGRANCAGSIGQDPEPEEPPAIAITEVMANPVDDRRDEWVEVLNLGPAAVDLRELRFFDGDAIDSIEAFEGGGTTLQPGQFGVIVDRGYEGAYSIDADALVVTVDDQTLGSGLSTSDPVSLLLADGVTVVSAFSSPQDPGNGRSVVRAPDAPDEEESWRPTECADGRMSTPGEADCVVEDVDLDCREQADCAEGLRCNGIPHDGSGEFGRCVDFDRVEGIDAACPGPDYACGLGLTCMGWSINSVRPNLWPNPFCVRGWQGGRFEGAPGQIPDDGQLTSAAVVYGLATVPVDIVVTARISHPDPSQLVVTVLDPSDTDAQIFDGAVDDPAILDGPIVALGNISRDDSVNGRWTLRVEDRMGGGRGDLDGWTLEIVSNFD